MKKPSYRLLSLLALVSMSMISACAHTQQETALDNKLANEPALKDSNDLSSAARHQIETAPDLTNEQRTKLLELQSSTHTKLDDLREQSLKVRELLVKEVIQNKFQAEEVSRLKGRLKKIEDNRLATIFGALGEANGIMGRMPQPQRESVMRDLIEDRK